MSAASNTLFLRLEGPLQAWGDTSKGVIRRSVDAPTKSGVIGLVCCAMGLSRQEACKRLPEFNELAMGVRIDRPGVRWWDWHTVGAKTGILSAKGEVKKTASTGAFETLITRREYLCDASFLVALQGEPRLIAELEGAIKAPKWTLYLGRKSCPPSRPLLEHPKATGGYKNLISALKDVPWRPRLEGDALPQTLECLLDWIPMPEEPEAPASALVWYDVPYTFDPPSHHPRFVVRKELLVGSAAEVEVGEPLQNKTPSPPRTRADYKNSEYQKARGSRLDADCRLCVFCKAPATTVQHITYRRAGGNETHDDLRSLCRLCHDAVTMIEYGMGMGLDRINPEDPQWRDQIIKKRDEIIKFRALETRRRRLAAEEVE